MARRHRHRKHAFAASVPATGGDDDGSSVSEATVSDASDADDDSDE